MTVEYLNADGWQDTVNRFGLTPLVKVGNLILVSGATGGIDSPDPEEQFNAAFQDVSDTLAAAGCGWGQVVKMTTYHQHGMRQHMEVLLEVKNRYVNPPYPAWTGVGVTELANPHALVEIDVIAVSNE